jgi:hypothetical protein
MTVSNRKRLAVGALATLAVSGGLLGGKAFPESRQASALSPSDRFSVNAQGQSYGSLADVGVPGKQYNSDAEPELALVVADSGIEGYIYSAELASPDFKTPEEAMAWTEENRSKPMVLDVFEADGVTRIGTFTVEASGSAVVADE